MTSYAEDPAAWSLEVSMQLRSIMHLPNAFPSHMACRMKLAHGLSAYAEPSI